MISGAERVIPLIAASDWDREPARMALRIRSSTRDYMWEGIYAPPAAGAKPFTRHGCFNGAAVSKIGVEAELHFLAGVSSESRHSARCPEWRCLRGAIAFSDTHGVHGTLESMVESIEEMMFAARRRMETC